MKNIAIIIFLYSSFSLAQQKYLIYFSDKNLAEDEVLTKVVEVEAFAKTILSEKSIERRKKVMGENFITYEDLPIKNEYIVKLKNIGINILNKLKWFNAVSAYLTDTEVELLQNEDFIQKIEQVKKLKYTPPKKENISLAKTIISTKTKNVYNYGPSFTQSELSDIPAVHNMGITGEDVIIGLLDSGYDWERHNSLRNRRVIAEYDFIFNDNETANDSKDPLFNINGERVSQHSHGTSVFSILAGFEEGKIIGPAFNSNFLLAKTEYIPTETNAEELNYAEALEWMDSIGVDITNSSLGYSEFDEGANSYTYKDMDGKTTIVTKAAELAFERGIVVITSAGNEGNEPWRYITAPGDGFNTLTIGAVTSTNIVSSFSSLGPTFDGRIKPEIVTMGSFVYHAVAGSDTFYNFSRGTSLSAPIAAGIAGLVLSAHPHLTNKQIRSILMESGDNVTNPNNNRGYGLVSALKAVTFPNIKSENNNFKINKIFPDTVYQKTDSIRFIYSEENSDFLEIVVSSKSENRLIEFEVPPIDSGSIISFSFELYDSFGKKIFEEPLDGNYHWEYGSEIISYKVENPIYIPKLPENFILSQNFPNPVNSLTLINFYIPEHLTEAKVKIDLFDVLGRKVKSVFNEVKNSGNHTVSLSTHDLSSGVYFYRLYTNEFSETKKLIVLK